MPVKYDRQTTSRSDAGSYVQETIDHGCIMRVSRIVCGRHRHVPMEGRSRHSVRPRCGLGKEANLVVEGGR
eukprot:10132219-Prorocentrum_lima.AAC.1